MPMTPSLPVKWDLAIDVRYKKPRKGEKEQLFLGKQVLYRRRWLTDNLTSEERQMLFALLRKLCRSAFPT